MNTTAISTNEVILSFWRGVSFGKKQQDPRDRNNKRQETKHGRIKGLQIYNSKIPRVHFEQPGPLNIEVN